MRRTTKHKGVELGLLGVKTITLEEKNENINYVSYPGSEKDEPKLPYVCPRCLNYTYGQ
jgi:hypothetical protein